MVVRLANRFGGARGRTRIFALAAVVLAVAADTAVTVVVTSRGTGPLGPAGPVAYVVDAGRAPGYHGTLVSIDLATGRVGRAISVRTNPSAVAITPRGTGGHRHQRVTPWRSGVPSRLATRRPASSSRRCRAKSRQDAPWSVFHCTRPMPSSSNAWLISSTFTSVLTPVRQHARPYRVQPISRRSFRTSMSR